MQIYLQDQVGKMDEHLRRLMEIGVTQYDSEVLRSQAFQIAINTSDSLFNVGRRSLFDYDIFPKRIMFHLCQWKQEDRGMMEGDTIVQQIYLPPIKGLSQKIICGVRVREVINEDNRFGFSYETLEGHVEKGISSFMFEKEGTGFVFSIRMCSAPANELAKLVAPLSLWYQRYCTRSALKHVKLMVER